MQSIDIFPWNDHFNTGIPEIDQQHRKLVQLLNALASSLAYRSSPQELKAILDELTAYSVYHFETEEDIWHTYMPGDSDELQHKAAHASFVKTVQRLHSELATKPADLVVQEALGFLATWLASHILETDKQMGFAVLEMQSGLNLEAAKHRAMEMMAGATRALINLILSIYATLTNNTVSLMREMADHKQASKNLHASEQRFHSLYDNMAEGVALHRIVRNASNQPVDYVFLDVNPAFELYTGLQKRDVIDKTASQVYGSVPYLDRYVHVVDSEVPVQFETYYAPFDKTFSISVSSPGPDQFATIFRDVSEEIQLERAFRQALDRFKAVIEASPIPMALNDDKLNITYLNNSFSKTFGYALDDIPTVADWWPKAYPDPAYREQVERLWQDHIGAVLKQGAHIDPMEVQIATRDGDVRTALVAATLLPKGLDDVHLVTLIDITERKRTGDALRESEKRFRALIDASAQIVWSCDPQGFVTEDSPTWRAYTGQTIERWLGYGYVDAIHPDDRQAVMDRWKNALTEGTVVSNTYRLRHHSGQWRWNEARAVPIRNEGGRIISWVGMNSDIHDREMARLDLKSAKEVADAANIAKSQFLATMSHEIRTPMNGILGMAQLLLMDIDDFERRDYARTILNSGNTLLTLLNDILDFSKIEAGKLELENSVIDPEQIMHETSNLFQENASEKGLGLEVHWEGAMQRYLADPHRLRQMLSNLTNNAVKFTTKGTIRLWAKEVERSDGRALLEFSVSDTGIGIESDKQELLFKPFSQADGSITRQFGGTGLGLSIVRSLAIRMGGDVGVESRSGYGSRFWFRIRADVIQYGMDRRNSARTSEGLGISSGRLKGNILIVEDNPTNQIVIQALLNKLGLTCQIASDGQAGLHAVGRDSSFDLILMDIQMPVMDGYEATRRIRVWEAEEQQRHLPIIALTADAFEEDRQRCLAAGMDDFVVKPVNLDKLTLALQRWLPVQKA